MDTDIKTIRKGSQYWRDLFYNIKTDIYLEADFDKQLYYKGDITALLDQERPKILITGTRSAYEKEHLATIDRMIRELSQNHYRPVIVTGIACGVETYTVKSALKYGLAVIVLSACSLEEIYPSANTKLAAKVVSSPECALLSCFPEGTAAIALNFLIKHRLASAISDCMVVPYSKNKGGSIVAANLMYELDKLVYALPGRIGDEVSQGCNTLISTGKARILYSYDQLKSIYVMRKSNEYVNPLC